MKVKFKKNKELASFESIKKIILVPKFTVENKLITPTFKIKKNVVENTYKENIDQPGGVWTLMKRLQPHYRNLGIKKQKCPVQGLLERNFRKLPLS